MEIIICKTCQEVKYEHHPEKVVRTYHVCTTCQQIKKEK